MREYAEFEKATRKVSFISNCTLWKLFVLIIERGETRVALVLRIANARMIDRRETEHNSHVHVSDGRRPVDFNFLHRPPDNCRTFTISATEFNISDIKFRPIVYNTSSFVNIEWEHFFRITIDSCSIQRLSDI